MNTIIVTPRSLSKGNHPNLKPLEDAGYELAYPAPGRIPTEAELLHHIPECVGWIAGIEPVSNAVIDAGHQLKVISRNGTGIDNLPLESITQRAIQVFKAEGTNARGVAELALTMILTGLRHVIPTHEGIRSGEWPRLQGREICDTTIGIVGLGAIGSAVATLANGLGATVLGHDPYAPADVVTHRNFQRTDLDKVLSQSDAISLHCPLPMNGNPLLGRDELSTLRPDAVLVNTARAGLVEESALLDALDDGALSSYATDVFDVEPPKQSRLTHHKRVVLTSHIGGFTVSSIRRSTERAVENLLLGLNASAD